MVSPWLQSDTTSCYELWSAVVKIGAIPLLHTHALVWGGGDFETDSVPQGSDGGHRGEPGRWETAVLIGGNTGSGHYLEYYLASYPNCSLSFSLASQAFSVFSSDSSSASIASNVSMWRKDWYWKQFVLRNGKGLACKLIGPFVIELVYVVRSNELFLYPVIELLGECFTVPSFQCRHPHS